jgi:plastocyanin
VGSVDRPGSWSARVGVVLELDVARRGRGHSTTITVSDNMFTPTPDTVSAGTVTFSWAGSNQHNVTWDSGPTPLPTNSVTQNAGSYNAPLKVGTYQYHCVVHGSVMSGTIVVH